MILSGSTANRGHPGRGVDVRIHASSQRGSSCIDAGAGLSAHAMRACRAPLAAEAGVNPLVIQHQLGHAELRTTQESYLGASDPDLLAPYAAVFDVD